jgi:hypothetical protein
MTNQNKKGHEFAVKQQARADAAEAALKEAQKRIGHYTIPEHERVQLIRDLEAKLAAADRMLQYHVDLGAVAIKQRDAAESRAATLAEEVEAWKKAHAGVAESFDNQTKILWEQAATIKQQAEELAKLAAMKQVSDNKWWYDLGFGNATDMVLSACKAEQAAAQATIKAKDEEIKKLVLAIGDHITARAERQATIKSLTERIAEVLDVARHTHQARYATQGPNAGKLLDACAQCGLDLRHDIHATEPKT